MAQGYAVILTIPPNMAHAEEFLGLQQRGREARMGLCSGASSGRSFTSNPWAGHPERSWWCQ
jgi:hypothetical protein